MKTKAKVRYDRENDVLYLFSAGGQVERSVEVAPGLSIDFGPKGQVLGVEILRASRVLSDEVVAALHARQLHPA